MIRQETTTRSDFKLVETTDDSQPIVLAEPEYNIAISYKDYYGTRFYRFFVDMQLSILFTMLLYSLTIGLTKSAVPFNEHMMMPISFCVFVVLKLVRGLNCFEKNYDSMLALDSSGAKLTFVDAFWRSLVLSFTLPLVPLNLLFMVTGSRKLLHDYLSDTIVRPVNEDSLTTFYPPAPKWWAIALVVAFLLFVSFYTQCQTYVCSIENVMAPRVFGENSKTLYWYLRLRDGIRSVPEDSYNVKTKLAASEERSQLALVCFGKDSRETAAELLYAAHLAAVDGSKAKCVNLIKQLQQMPQNVVAEAVNEERTSGEWSVDAPLQEYGYFIELATGARRHGKYRSNEPVFEENIKAAENLKHEILGTPESSDK